MPDKQRRTRRQFTPEFKRDAVELVRTSGRPIAEIARELGIYDSTLGNWVRQDRIDRGEQEGLSSEERARLGELEVPTEPAGRWQGGFFVHSQEQPWDVERRLYRVSERHGIPMLACYVETSDFGYALALLRGQPLARYVVNAHSAEVFVEGVWALEQCVAMHGRDWQQMAFEGFGLPP